MNGRVGNGISSRQKDVPHRADSDGCYQQDLIELRLWPRHVVINDRPRPAGSDLEKGSEADYLPI